jgi:hypothetical protein
MLLVTTCLHILAEQERAREGLVLVVPTELAVGSFVLMSYLVRPPSKLAARSVVRPIPYC